MLSLPPDNIRLHASWAGDVVAHFKTKVHKHVGGGASTPQRALE